MKLLSALDKCIDTFLGISPLHYEVLTCQNFVDYMQDIQECSVDSAWRSIDLIQDGAGGKVHSTGSKKKSVESRQETQVDSAKLTMGSIRLWRKLGSDGRAVRAEVYECADGNVWEIL